MADQATLDTYRRAVEALLDSALQLRWELARDIDLEDRRTRVFGSYCLCSLCEQARQLSTESQPSPGSDDSSPALDEVVPA